MIGQMRLQWWRDQVTEIVDGKGPSKGHPVAEPLSAVVDKRSLTSAKFLTLLDAREQDMSDTPPATMESLVEYCHGTSATLASLALDVLAVSDSTTVDAAQYVGTAWALSGIARAVRHRALAGHIVMLPGDAMASAGLALQDLQSPDKAGAAADIIKCVCDESLNYIVQARETRNRLDLVALPVLLQATLAESYIKEIQRAGYRIYDPRLKNGRPAVAKLWWNAWRKRY